MRTSTYLVFNKKRVVTTRYTKPVLKNGEYAILVRLEVPDSIFATEYPVVEIAVPERQVLIPVLTVEDPV